MAAQFGHVDPARRKRQDEGPWRRLRLAGQPAAAHERALVSPAVVPAAGLVSIFVGGGPVLVAITPDVSTTITVGSLPVLVAITPDGTHAYVTGEGTGSVSVIDTGTGTVINSITVGNSPAGVAIAPDGNDAYVTCSSSGTVVVVPTVPVVAQISPAQGPAAGDIPVTITGTGLDDITAAVSFGPYSATNLFLTAAGTKLLATAPGGAGTVPVTVTTPGGSSNALDFTYE